VTHTEIAQRIAEVAPDKNQPIHLYCRSGHRAEAALNELKKLGYSNVTNHGGYDDLIKAGLK
ncbi:TPA: rhodanese-like domain-containing protein, partial [Mannheimia haemolytica]|nr:rhodanese-like domain-containing protein [Mannheimia haemolytica]